MYSPCRSAAGFQRPASSGRGLEDAGCPVAHVPELKVRRSWQRNASKLRARSAELDEPTKVKLHRVLLEAGLPDMADKALEGYYDDYESPVAAPIGALVADLRSQGREDLARRAIDGEWDATKEEGAAWFEREGKHLLKDEGR